MQQYDNPARRLYSILVDATKACAELGSPSKVPARQVWQVVFGEGDESHLVASMDEIYGLIYLTKNCINRLQVSSRKAHLGGLGV